DADNNRLPVGRCSGQLHAPVAKNEDSAGLLAFDKQDRVFRIGRGRRNRVQRSQDRTRKIAKDPLFHQRTRQTAFDDLQAVGRLHVPARLHYTPLHLRYDSYSVGHELTPRKPLPFWLPLSFIAGWAKPRSDRPYSKV